MMDGALTTAAEPDGAPRLAMLDILRGIAILGILPMNISDFGSSLYAFIDGADVRRLGWTSPDQVAWWLRELFVSGTARCLLELLFGAGMAILTDRAATRMGERRVLGGYAWRNLVLLGFGLVHVFVLLWPGDILHSYALAALVAVAFRQCRPRLLLTLGLVFATVQLVGQGTAAIQAQAERSAVLALQAGGQPLTPGERATVTHFRRTQAAQASVQAAAAARVTAEDRARTGAALDWARALWGVFGYFQRTLLEVLVVWEAASTMLIGAALYRWGVLQGHRSRRFYARLTIIAYALGLGLRVWAAHAETRFDDAPSLAYAFEEYARLLTTLGHVGLVNLLATGAAARWLTPFAAAGRTALTLYILQTLAGLWVLYPPWGLALYNRQGWAALMLTALLVDAALLLLAIWWTRRFAIAPIEWAWRSLVAGRRLPFRRRAGGEVLRPPPPG